ncbi:MAG: NAD(P)-binding domain-containing protein [Rhizobium sp.]|uniref:flavin-containing monooxygenase n=1 Tax=Rhizobium sp. TaxID=391 RepID=UPI00068F01F0
MTGNRLHRMPDNTVAIVGAGPSGLACARWLRAHGLEPLLFEAADQLGGQWNSLSPMSGVWPGMRTNTSRVTTAFSDMDHIEGTATYPRHDEMLAYLERYAEHFDLLRRIRTRARVEHLSRGDDGLWHIHSNTDGVIRRESFRRAIVATGRHVAPDVPDIAGIESFCGSFGAAHTSHYYGPERLRGRSVVVAGCSISALEIAAEIALAGAAQVSVSYRRQRYVLPKLIKGVPTESVMFTRAAAIAAERCPPDIAAEALKAMVLNAAGSPEQFGARKPHENIFAAGITQSQNFLPAVAEGRIVTRPWIERIDGRTVHFADGSAVEADALFLGTGYRLSLPFLSPELAETVELDTANMTLHDFTLHPDLPGLAFAGLIDLVGPFFPAIELQARWIAYSFAGIAARPTPEKLAMGLSRSRAARTFGPAVPTHVAALAFARNAGIEPSLEHYPELERALLFGPLSAISFRLEGPDRLPNASYLAKKAAAEFGAITSEDFTAEERNIRDMLRAAAAMAAA